MQRLNKDVVGLKKYFYGFGGLSYSVISQTVANFFMFFATSVLGIRGTTVGIALAISTIWDGLSDTIVGYISDNFPLGKFGKRNGYMLIATIGMAVTNVFLWCVPMGLSEGMKFVWILVFLLILETFNTMFSTPYMALGNELATNEFDRTKVGATNTVFYLIGMITSSLLMLIFLPSTEEYPIGQLNPVGYTKIAIFTSAICLVAGLISSVLTISKPEFTKISSKPKLSISGLMRGFLAVFKDGRVSKIIWGYVLTSVATVILCSVGLHFFTYSLFYTSGNITILLLTLLIGTILSQPLWVMLSKRGNKKNALVFGIIITILSVFAVILIYIFRIELYEISFWLMMVAIFFCGIGSGALYTLPTSIYGDIVMGISRDGACNATYSSAMTFAGNMASSISGLIVGVMLDVIGFDASLKVQTLFTQSGLAVILFVGIEVSLMLSCLIFSRYSEKINKL